MREAVDKGVWDCNFLFVLNKFLLNEAEDDDLCRDDAHEHGERIDGGVCYGGRVVVCHLVGIGECRGIGVAATHHTYDREIIHLVFGAGNDADNQKRYHRDEYAVSNPDRSSDVEDSGCKVLASRNTYGSKEETDADLA